MNENDKDFYENTENPYELFKAAQRDIMNISNTIESKRFPLEDNIETICRCAAESWVLRELPAGSSAKIL